MTTINEEMTLDGFSLKQALESMYCAFASVLRGHNETDSPDLYKKTIPECVFAAAVGAGWFPLAEDNFDPKIGAANGDVIWQADWQATKKTLSTQWVLDHIEEEKEKGRASSPQTTYTRNQAQRLVQLGDFIVQRTYAEEFFSLLSDVIAFHLADGTEVEELLRLLPKKTTAQERQDLLTKYIAALEAEGRKPTVKEIISWAGVDYSWFTKWKNGRDVADSTPAAKRISLLLRYNKRSRPRPYRTSGQR